MDNENTFKNTFNKTRATIRQEEKRICSKTTAKK